MKTLICIKVFISLIEPMRYGEYSAAVGAATSCFNKIYLILFEWDY